MNNTYVSITKQDMDRFAKTSKGWVCNTVGNEYVYDFHLKKYPIIIKMASSIRIDTKRARNKGADAIRIFAVEKESLKTDAKISRGLVKARTVYRIINWRVNARKQIESVIVSSKVVYDKYRRKNVLI